MANARFLLTRYAWLSIATALCTIALKTGAFYLTGSVGLLSDAVESLVNLAGAILALAMLIVAARPADEKHPFGHSKAEYFASGFEGLLIILAACGIVYTAAGRFFHPEPLTQVGLGLLISLGASVANLFTARVLIQAGKKYDSITLEADGKHLMTDVWTSIGVMVGITFVWVSGWLFIDALVAAAVALNIFWTGGSLVRRSVDGLMDASLPKEEMRAIDGVMAKYRQEGISFHFLRARRAASKRFISVHMLVPGEWSVHRAHCLAEEFEKEVREALGTAMVTTHLESLDDSESFNHEGEPLPLE